MDEKEHLKKTILFTGADTQTGTTMVALAAAEELAREGFSVLFLQSGFWPVNEFLPQHMAFSAGELLAGLLEGTLTAEDIQQAAAESRGIDVLPGIRDGRQGKYFLPEDLEAICRIAEGAWDWILVDGGCLLCSALQPWAQETMPGICIVVTQQEKTLKRYRQWKNMTENLTAGPQIFVLNKFTDSSAFCTGKEVAQQLGCEEGDLISVPYVPYGWQAEADGTTLLNFRRFRKAVCGLTEQMKRQIGTGDGIWK